MTTRRFVIEERKDPSGWWIVLAAAIFIAFWKVLLVAVIVVGLIWLLLKKRKEQSDYKQVNDAWLSMQADHQNMLYQQGDPMGTYGRFDPITIPNTMPQVPRDWYDYDDGLRGWK